MLMVLGPDASGPAADAHDAGPDVRGPAADPRPDVRGPAADAHDAWLRA